MEARVEYLPLGRTGYFHVIAHTDVIGVLYALTVFNESLEGFFAMVGVTEMDVTEGDERDGFLDCLPFKLVYVTTKFTCGFHCYPFVMARLPNRSLGVLYTIVQENANHLNLDTHNSLWYNTGILIGGVQ